MSKKQTISGAVSNENNLPGKRRGMSNDVKGKKLSLIYKDYVITGIHRSTVSSIERVSRKTQVADELCYNTL